MSLNTTGSVRGQKTWDIINGIDLMTELASWSLDMDDLIYGLKPNDGPRKKVYFAGPWFSSNDFAFMKWIEETEQKLRPYSHYQVYFPRQHDGNSPKETFLQNVKGIDDADIVLAWISTKDVGTSWEIGRAYTAGKQVILLGYDDTCFTTHISLMIAYNGKCLTSKSFGEFLLNKLTNDDFITVDNLWEGKE